MKKIERKLFISLCIVLVALLASICFNFRQYTLYRNCSDVSIDTVVVTKVVTTERKDTMPVVQNEKVVGSVSISDILSNKPDAAEQHIKRTDSTNADYCNTTNIPIVQREYGDSVYTAWVSGILLDSISPRLDSIRIKERTVFQEVTIKRDLLCKKKRWHIGIIASYGYGIESKRAEPFLGVGITYSLLSF